MILTWPQFRSEYKKKPHDESVFVAWKKYKEKNNTKKVLFERGFTPTKSKREKTYKTTRTYEVLEGGLKMFYLAGYEPDVIIDEIKKYSGINLGKEISKVKIKKDRTKIIIKYKHGSIIFFVGIDRNYLLQLKLRSKLNKKEIKELDKYIETLKIIYEIDDESGDSETDSMWTNTYTLINIENISSETKIDRGGRINTIVGNILVKEDKKSRKESKNETGNKSKRESTKKDKKSNKKSNKESTKESTTEEGKKENKETVRYVEPKKEISTKQFNTLRDEINKYIGTLLDDENTYAILPISIEYVEKNKIRMELQHTIKYNTKHTIPVMNKLFHIRFIVGKSRYIIRFG